MYNTHALKRLSCSVLPSNVLRREALLAALHDAIAPSSGYKLILVCAPGGYGKTTLLADFLRQTDLPCCWYFLDHNDADKITFLSLLMMSIRERFPQCAPRMEMLLASLRAHDEADVADGQRVHTVGTFVEALTTIIEEEIPTRFAIALCNYHEVNGKSVFIKHFMDLLLSHLPSQCLVILESRAVPDLDLAPFLARREIFGLGSSGLRFSPQEIHQLAQLQGSTMLTSREATELAETFDGWITGILLSTRLGDLQFLHSTTSASLTWGAPAMRMNRENLFAYVVNEIFSRDPEMYTFIKELSILPVMEPGICNELSGITDSLERLTYLEQQGLFVTHTDEGSQMTFICHPVLRELFCEALQKQNLKRFQALQRRAAELFSVAHDYSQAIYHAYQAEDYHFAAELIMEACVDSGAKDFSESLTHWIDKLPEEMMQAYPRLLVVRANIYLLSGEYAGALPLLEKALKRIDEICDAPMMSKEEIVFLRAEISLARSKALYLEGKYEQAQELCQEIMAVLPPDEIVLRADAHLRLGMCARQSGDFITSIQEFQQALQLEGHHMAGYRAARIYDQLASSYHMVGNHALSEHYHARAARCWEQLQDEAGKVKNLIAMGIVLQRKGEFVEAEQVLSQALTLANTLHFLQGQAYALVSLADLYQDQGKYDQALKAADDGLVLARKLKDRYLLTCTLCTLAMTYLLMGDPHTACIFISEIDRQIVPDKTMSYEQALRDLTYGAILLSQGHYQEALAYLTTVEATLRSNDLKRELLQALIRLAACYLAQQYISRVIECMQEVIALVTQYGYETLALLELQRVPPLLQAIHTQPELLFLCSHFFPDLEKREQETQNGHNMGPLVTPTAQVTAMPQDAARLRFVSFGEPAVFLQETPITHWRLVDAMELCFFLLDRGRPCHKEQILTALWPDKEGTSDQVLRTAVYYLRKALGERTVVSRGRCYSLDLSAVYGTSVWYDVAIFCEQYQAAKAAIDGEDENMAYSLLSAIVQLYRGDYLLPFYSDWCNMRRDELRQMYIKARQQLARMAWRREQFDESATHWQHILTVDKCLEEAHYGLMRCYLRQGKRGLALRQYQRCVHALREELAVTPGATIQALYNRLVGNTPQEV